MRFIIECKYCNRIIKEAEDRTYKLGILIRKKETCKDCQKLIEKVGK